MSDPAQSSTEALAINGGSKVRTTPPPVRRLFGTEERDAVVDLFNRAIAEGSHLLGYNGEQEEAYCREFCEFMGGGFADGVNSGTNAVFVALRALELEPYSEVITSPVSDPGGVMPVAMCNLIPVAADAEPGFYNTSADEIAKRITPRTRAILVTHITGRPVDMEPVMDLANKHNLYVIEDCAQAHGTVIFCRNAPCDACREKGLSVCPGRKAGTFGHIATFSTMFGKQHACGGQGGFVYTRDESLYWRVRRHADRGKPFGISLGGGAGAGVGGASGGGANAVAALNCNMDELHACIGRVQLRKLPDMIAHRRKLARRIIDGCAGLAGIHPVGDPPHGESSYWFLFLNFDHDAYRVDKETFVKALCAEGLHFGPSYAYYPSRMLWAKNRQVFGTSALPWSGAGHDAERPDAYPLDNVMKVDRDHVFMLFNEGWTEDDAEDAVRILRKVDGVFRK